MPAHGDWVVEAINQTLDDPNKTEILYDLDTLTTDGHFGKIFDQSNYVIGGTTYFGSNFDKILSNFIYQNDSRFNEINTEKTYSIAGISMSISGERFPSLDVQTFLTSLEQWNAPFSVCAKCRKRCL